MAQGMGGFMSLTGMADGEPTRSGVPVSDIMTGMYSVIGILAALQRRERTGQGGFVDTALVDTTVGVLANQGLNFLASGKIPARIGNAHPNIVPYQVFPVADGYIIIATGNDSQYVKLCGVLGAPELAKHPNYIDNKARLANRADIVDKLSALTAKFKMQDLADKLEAVGVPAGPINNARPGVRRPARQAPRHEARHSERSRQGRQHPRHPHPDHAWTASRWTPGTPRRGWASTRRRF